MEKTCIGIYCDNGIYSTLLSEAGSIFTKNVEKHEGVLRHFKFMRYFQSLEDIDLCVIVQNDESIPIINYLRREKKRKYLSIEYSPVPVQANYRQNPDLPTIARKLAYRKKISDIVFSEDNQELSIQIERIGDGKDPIHMRTLSGFVLSWLAAVHGIFSLEEY